MSTTVLIIDDDRSFTGAVRGALEAEGHSVVVHEDASLETIRSVLPSAILMSAELPKSSGFSLCNRLRRDRELRTTPILLLSRSASQEALDKHAEQPGRANLYALKPLDAPGVVELVARLMASTPPPLERSPGDRLPVTNDSWGPVSEEPASLGPRSATDVSPPPLFRDGAKENDNPKTAEPLEASPSERWPQARFDEAFTATMAPDGQPRKSDPEDGRTSSFSRRADGSSISGIADAQASTRRAGPEGRLEQLRALVKRYEQREPDLVALHREMNERGQELGRQVAGLDHELNQARQQVQVLEREKADLSAQLDETETSFRRFYDQVTDVFTEKDAEERTTLQRLQTAEEEVARLVGELTEAREQRDDDARRLKFLQEELEELHERLEAKESEAEQLRTQIEPLQQEQQELAARLATTESVAIDRADALAELSERLDQQALEAERNRAALSEQHAKDLELAKRDAEERLVREVESLCTQHEARLAELNDEQTRASELAQSERDRLQLEYETEVERIEQARSEALQWAEAKETEATEALSQARDELESLRAAYRELENDKEGLRLQVDNLSVALDASLQTEKEQLEAYTAQLKELDRRRAEAESSAQELSERARSLELSLAEKDQLLVATEIRVQELIAEIEAAQHSATNVQDLDERAARLGEQLKAAQARADDREQLLVEADEANELLGQRLREAEKKADDTERRLSDAHAHIEELANFRLEAETRASTAEQARAEAEAKAVQDQQLKAREAVGTEERVEALEASLVDAEREAEASKEALRVAEERVRALERSLSDAEDEIESSGERVLELHSRLDELRAELAARPSGPEDRVEQLEIALRASEQARKNAEQARARIASELERHRNQNQATKAPPKREGPKSEGQAADLRPLPVLTLEELEAHSVDLRQKAGSGGLSALIGQLEAETTDGKGPRPSETDSRPNPELKDSTHVSLMKRAEPQLLDEASKRTPPVTELELYGAEPEEHDVTEIIDIRKLES